MTEPDPVTSNRPAAALTWVVLALIAVIFCVRNVPWRLDDFDQAKQAFVSFEMVEAGHWWYQHTPGGMVATKPPLAGWMSAACQFVLGGWWDGAWRLPSLTAAVILLCLLFREGNKLLAGWGGLLAISAFSLNTMAPRLATMVRTDMLMAAWIFGMGLLIYRKVRSASPWTPRDRWILFALVQASVFTKGPIAYVLVLPGVAFMMWWRKREPAAAHAWTGWWPWIVPLLPLAAWAVAGSIHDREFYEQVVLKEFLGRVTGEHRSQPVYYYLPHLLQKFAPWSLLLIALACVREVRAAIRKDPSLMWLAVWALGGLLVFSLIPSKRTDRIFSVLPPLCLLLPAMIAALPEAKLFRWPARRVMVAAIMFAMFFSGGYAIYSVAEDLQRDEGALVRFGRQAAAISEEQSWRMKVVGRLDEGLLLYTRRLEFLNEKKGIAEWTKKSVDALVMPEATLDEIKERLGPHRVLLKCARTSATRHGYVLVVRDGPPASAESGATGGQSPPQ